MDGGVRKFLYRPARRLRLLLLLLPALGHPALSDNADIPSPEASSPHLMEQRELYRQASKALANREKARFSALRGQLLDYPLLAYLDYADLSIRIEQADPEEIAQFLSTYRDSPLAAWLRDRRLDYLAHRKRWQEFIRFYDSNLRSTDLACYYAYAEYIQGDRRLGISRGRELWQVGTSQPASCDPIFDKLIDDGHIDDAIAWQRYLSAILNHEYRLADYVTRFFTKSETRRRAALYEDVDRNPRQVVHYRQFPENTVGERQIIAHGITHLASIDALLALKTWNRYHQSHDFEPDLESSIIGTLVKSLYRQGHTQSADEYLSAEQEKINEEILEWRLRELIETANWSAIVALSDQLGPRHSADARWKYWRARALALSGNLAPEVTQSLYRDLSRERSFYGFLASEWLDSPYQMQHEPVAVSANQLQALANTPAFRRIRELYFHGELTWARREWYNHLADADPVLWIVSAKLAEQWGWHNQAIMSMIQARYWNDIDVRFPLPHKDDFLTQANATAIPVNLLLALSRQESAFNPSVTSPAGAKGLMQLMPATARETARKHNIRYAGSSDLENPGKNILIGSRYYRQMLERFNHNRILATAAYNAGPGRVASWSRRSGGTLPFDAWIEVIPFRETRNYVQNVLAFSVIYAHHLGLETAILSADEKNAPL